MRTTTLTIYTENISLTSGIYPTQVASKDQGARESYDDWHCFNLSFLSQSMDCDNMAHNHWFLIAQAQKIDALQVKDSDGDACKWNGKLFSPPSLIPQIYFHYFDTLPIPLQELTFPWKSVASLLDVFADVS